MKDPRDDRAEIPTPITYDASLRERITANLGSHRRREIALDGKRHAAVAIVLVDSEPGEARVDSLGPDGAPAHDATLLNAGPEGSAEGASGGAAFLLCRRPPTMNRHPGQYALPGGRIEPGEGVVEAALRETREEVGVTLDAGDVLGLLDDYETRSGFVMTPVVVWAGARTELVPDPVEVHTVYRVGLHQLQRRDSPRFAVIPESDRPVVAVPLGGALVHAPTAAVLVQLNGLALLGRSDSVQHYEQPVFAWS